MRYSDKLKDPRWQRKRLEIFQRDGFKCMVCYTEIKTLHVHHLKYNGKDPWCIENSALVTVCVDCHNMEKKNKGVIEKKLSARRKTIRLSDFLKARIK